MARTTWTKHLSVDKNIVRLLSASTYEDFPGAIREMVSNAYDADATIVNITIDLDKDFIEITDDGIGMTPEEFDLFLRIAGQKVSTRISPELGRQRIGQFGIGFLAIFPFGELVKVTSSAFRSDIHFEATIPTEKYIRYDQMVIDVANIPIPGYQIQDPQYKNKHETSIRISGITELVRSYFQDRGISSRHARKTIRAMPPMTQLEWNLREDLPIDYPEVTALMDAFSDLGSSGIRVFLNGNELFRHAPGSQILENSTWNYRGIKCRYVIATDWKSITPTEERYIKQRLRNVGIGKRTTFGLGLTGRAYSRLHWLTGEIRILKGLDNILSIDRSRFIDSPDYDKFSEYFRGKLSHYANYVETVSEAERDIKRQLTDSRIAEVGSRKEIINRKVETLESKGFTVVKKSVTESPKVSEPITVDVDQKMVSIIDDHPSFHDNIKIDGENLPIQYIQEGENNNNFHAVSRADDGTVIINANYPLFKSRRYGEVLKKIFVLMLVLTEKTDSPKDLLIKFTEQIQRELGDIS